MLSLKKTTPILLLLLYGTSSHAGVLDLELGIGKHRSIFSLDALLPVYQGKDDALLVSSAAKKDDLTSIEGDLGAAYRISGIRNDIFGLNYFLYSRTVGGRNYQQHSIGAEYLSQWLDFRANAYVPISKGPSSTYTDKVIDDISKNDVIELHKEHAGALGGYDLSLGIDLGAMYLSATHYAFGRKANDKILGIKGRVEIPVSIADPLELKIGMEAVHENVYRHPRFSLFIGGKFVFGEVKDNLNRRMLTTPVIRDKDIKVKGYGAGKLKEEKRIVLKDAISRRALNIEDPITGEMTKVAMTDIKIVNNYAELDEYLKDSAMNRNRKLLLIKNDFTNDGELLNVENTAIDNLVIAGSSRITVTLKNGEKMEHIFNPERTYASENPVSINIQNLKGTKNIFHELKINTHNNDVSYHVKWSPTVEFSNSIISNKDEGNLIAAGYLFKAVTTLKMNNIKIREVGANNGDGSRANPAASSNFITFRNGGMFHNPSNSVAHLRNIDIKTNRKDPGNGADVAGYDRSATSIFAGDDAKYNLLGNNAIAYDNNHGQWMLVFHTGALIKADVNSTLTLSDNGSSYKKQKYTVLDTWPIAQDGYTAQSGLTIRSAFDDERYLHPVYGIKTLVWTYNEL